MSELLKLLTASIYSSDKRYCCLMQYNTIFAILQNLFNFKTMKMNTSYNIAQSANEMLLNNSDLQMHQQSSGNNNNNYEYRQHGNQVGNVMGTQNGRGERKAYLASTATTIGGSNVNNKNSSSKYSALQFLHLIVSPFPIISSFKQ